MLGSHETQLEKVSPIVLSLLNLGNERVVFSVVAVATSRKTLLASIKGRTKKPIHRLSVFTGMRPTRVQHNSGETILEFLINLNWNLHSTIIGIASSELGLCEQKCYAHFTEQFRKLFLHRAYQEGFAKPFIGPYTQI